MKEVASSSYGVTIIDDRTTQTKRPLKDSLDDIGTIAAHLKDSFVGSEFGRLLGWSEIDPLGEGVGNVCPGFASSATERTSTA